MALSLRLIDRSRREIGLSKCQFERWLKNAFTNGYGIRRRVEALPLATGSVIHKAFEPILLHAKQTGAPPPLEALPLLTDAALKEYAEKGRKKIIDFGVSDDTGYQLQMNEQMALARGLVYAWTAVQLPWVLGQQRIVQVEEEEVYVVGCTCGLTDGFGTAEQHDARECAGFGYQCRGDFFTAPPSMDSLVYHDFKSTGWLNEGWREGWRYKIQVAASGIAAERKFGIPVSHVVIHGLYKGKRQREYNPANGKYDVGPWKQNSDLTYCYYKAGNPPMWPELWQVEKPTGKGARTEWEKRGTWEYPGGTWAFLASLSQEQLAAQTLIAGPFEVNRDLLKSYLRSLVPDERRHQVIEHQLFEVLQAQHGHWSSPGFQEALDRLIPKSWDCYRFGKPCDMLSICHKHPGWEDPLGSGAFQLRRPHHEPELLQMRARGLEPPEDEEAIEEDES